MSDVPDVVRRPSRLRALAALDANAESSAQALDRIAGIACRVLDTPVVLVNLVGADRQRFIGCGGPEEGSWASMREMPVTAGFCPFALGADDAYAFADARTDPELAANPAVGQLGVVAYAGVPLRAPDGEPVGTLCAIDHEPHEWSDDDLALLGDLAASAVAELQLLAATRLAARQQARLRTLAALSSALVPARTAQDVVDAVARVVDRLGANAVALFVPEASGQTLRAAAASGSERVAREAAMPPDPEAARTARPQFLPARADVPLPAGEHCVGVLSVCFADERVLPADDREYLSALAGVAGLALARVTAAPAAP